MKRGSWSVESTIGLVFTIVIAVIVAMVLAVIGLTAYAVTTRHRNRPSSTGRNHGRRETPLHRSPHQ